MKPRGYGRSRVSASVARRKMKTMKVFGVSISLILINMAAVMERADENLLPSVYKEVSETFKAGPTDLGYLTFIRNFIQALASPLAGVLVLHYDRPTVLAMGTVCWALSTAAVGASQHFWQVAFWRAVNGFGLAIVIPALQSFIADSYLAGARGTGFGLLNFVGSVGGIGGGVLATVMAGQEFWGFPGWRCAFMLMAFLSLLIGFLVFMFVVDPRRLQIAKSGSDSKLHRTELGRKDSAFSSSSWDDSWAAMKSVMKVKTFQIIVLQGIVGSLPWTAMVFFTMWFELIVHLHMERMHATEVASKATAGASTPAADLYVWFRILFVPTLAGFDNNSSAALISLLAIGCAIGSFFGGFLGDRVSMIYPHAGRVMCAQFSAFVGIPFSWFLLMVIPQSVASWNTFATTLFIMGLTISWCGTCANNPMFAEVVPAKHRTMIYAFDRAFEGSFSSFAAPAVGILAEKIYGYGSKPMDAASGSAQEASALSKGLLSMMAVPWLLCCMFYSPLYLTFKKDQEAAKLAAVEEEELLLVAD